MTEITINVGENEKKFLMRLSEKHNASIDELIREAIQEYWAEEYYSFFKRVADTPQTDKDKVVCPNCGRSDYIRSFEKDFNIKNSEYRYKCINCNTYINDTPQTDCEKCAEYGSYKCTKCDGEMYYKPQTDCGWK